MPFETAFNTIKDEILNYTNTEKRTNMYYSNGNYEAFADAQKPAGVDNKSA